MILSRVLLKGIVMASSIHLIEMVQHDRLLDNKDVGINFVFLLMFGNHRQRTFSLLVIT
jgi:hypothetical protein